MVHTSSDQILTYRNLNLELLRGDDNGMGSDDETWQTTSSTPAIHEVAKKRVSDHLHDTLRTSTHSLPILFRGFYATTSRDML